MRINHTVSSIDIISGGPARSVTHLIEALLEQREELTIDLNTLESSDPIITNFLNKTGHIFFHGSIFFGYSREIENHLKSNRVDLFHGHGLWQLPVHQMSKVARKKKVPYIITPRGMLEPWSLRQGKFKKKIALKLFQYKDLAKATCIHATAPMEVESIRALGFKNPIALIPNGINISEFPAKAPIKLKAPKKILFLSRIHIKKGIENLIDAWALIDENLRKSWKIEIVGNGDISYIASLKNRIAAKNLGIQIEITKPVFGAEKIKLFREASLFVLPTFSENFGIVIAEALASYTPVITTKGTPWQELDSQNCGWWIDIGIEPLKEALLETLYKNESQLSEMGKNGRKLMEEKYSMESVAKQMMKLYEWILTKKNKPNFINEL